MILAGMLAGSFAGGYVATLFGADVISFASLAGSTAGGILGIWLAFRFTR
jgi:hypothetical protein